MSTRTRVLLAVGLLALLFIYNIFSRTRPLPNLYLGQMKVSGNREHVEALVWQKADFFENGELVLRSVGREDRKITARELGIKIDREATVDAIMNLGRSGDFANDLRMRALTLAVPVQMRPQYSIDFTHMETRLSQILSALEAPAQDARITIEGGRARVEEDKVGQVLDRLHLVDQIYQRIDRLEVTPIELAMVVDNPLVRSQAAQELLAQAEKMTARRLTFLYGRDNWWLDPEEIGEMLELVPLSSTALTQPVRLLSLYEIKLAKISGRDDFGAQISLSEEKLEEFIAGIAKAVDRPTVNATLTFDGVRVRDFKPASDGQELDREATRGKIREGLGRDTLVVLPVTLTRAKIANEKINSLGIVELMGKGESYFAGSIANRVSNIMLAASRVSGIIIAPGETFSFNNSVGEVSDKTGYKKAYVISEGRTILDDGGGVCQISTTIFRAALASGLPIAARTAHAYRVGYYEQRGFKPGLDATVWAPAVDLRFKNDTPAHLLIQVTLDAARAKVEVAIYGTSDGRRVEISDPAISDVKPALPDKYQDDPTLSRGTVKQVDFAAVGAKVVFGRKVYRGGETIIDEKFTSVYKPWQAVYLVGTGG